MDLNPASVDHTLVLPREHLENIYELPEKKFAKMALVIKRVCDAVKKTIGAEGITILQLNGSAAGQVVMHFHVHVIPRFREDSISEVLGVIGGIRG